MECFSCLGRKKKKSKCTKANDFECLSNLKNQKYELEEDIRHIQSQIQEYTALAKERKDEGKMQAAKNMLIRKKSKEQLIISKNRRRDDLEQEIAQLEKKVMNDAAEAKEKQYKMSAAFIGLVSPLSANDKDAILTELKEMRAEQDNEAEIPEEDSLPQLPDVPSDSISEAEEDSATRPMLCQRTKLEIVRLNSSFD